MRWSITSSLYESKQLTGGEAEPRGHGTPLAHVYQQMGPAPLAPPLNFFFLFA